MRKRNHRSRRRSLALHFLTNISLDGRRTQVQGKPQVACAADQIESKDKMLVEMDVEGSSVGSIDTCALVSLKSTFGSNDTKEARRLGKKQVFYVNGSGETLNFAAQIAYDQHHHQQQAVGSPDGAVDGCKSFTLSHTSSPPSFPPPPLAAAAAAAAKQNSNGNELFAESDADEESSKILRLSTNSANLNKRSGCVELLLDAAMQPNHRQRHRHKSNSTITSLDSNATDFSAVPFVHHFCSSNTSRVTLLNRSVSRWDAQDRQRFIMTTARRTPFAMFSVISHTIAPTSLCSNKSPAAIAENGGEPRHRNLSSGSNSIMDILPSFGLVVPLDADNAEEVSYGALLESCSSPLSHALFKSNCSLDQLQSASSSRVSVPTAGADTATEIGLFAAPNSLDNSLSCKRFSSIDESSASSLNSSFQRSALSSAPIQSGSKALISPACAKNSTLVLPSDTREIDTLEYHPHLLDDPHLMTGRHHTLMRFQSMMTSVIDYVRPDDLKRCLNERFQERFPTLNITLSKLRSLKAAMTRAVRRSGVDLWVVAQAFVYFEKLILKNLVTKSNRKLCTAASILLSAKLNDIKGVDLTRLFQELENIFKVSRRDLLIYEMAVFVGLEFSLHISDVLIVPHFERIIRLSLL